MATIKNDPLKNYSVGKTPQREPLPGKNQVQNNAGGFVFTLDPWKQLERFLILGTAGGTFYVSQDKLTRDNANMLLSLIQKDGVQVVKTVVDVDSKNRAPKMNPLIFTLAVAMATGDLATRHAAEEAVLKVCRIATHINLFTGYLKQFKSLNGRIFQRTIARWYNEKSTDQLAYQIVKYRQRGGYSHRDLINLSHVKPVDTEHSALYKWAMDYQYGNNVTPPGIPLVSAFTEAQTTDNKTRIVELIRTYNLPWEAVPDKFINEPLVWEALLDANIGYTALIRQLTRLTKIGLLKELSSTLRAVEENITDADAIQRGRVHPLAILNALVTYANRRGQTTDYTPVQRVSDALNAAFYKAFEYIEPTGVRTYLAIDCSGSMSWETSKIAGSNLFAREGAAAIAMVAARTEKDWTAWGYTTAPTKIPISATMSLNDVLNAFRSVGTGGTDCAQPILHAQKQQYDVDAFYILTDNETWAGSIHPSEALKQYRRTRGLNSKLIVFGMAATEFTIADPSDTGMLDVVGLDSSALAVTSRFVRGEI